MSRVLIIAGLAESLLNFRGGLIRAIQAKGYEVHAIAPTCDTELAAQLKAANIYFHPIELQRSGLNPITDLYSFLGIRSVCRSVQPDLVLAYTIKPVIYGSLAARSLGIRRRFALITGTGYSFTASGSPLHALLGFIARTLYRLALIGSSGVFFQNPDDRDVFIRHGLVSSRTPIHLVNGSGVDLEHFAAAPLPDKASFLLIARMLAGKGIREYVNAARRVKKTHPEAVFTLIGPLDPSPNAIPEDEINAWVREGVVHYLGPVKDVRLHIAQASVFVLPSYGEGTPRSVLEAMAMGRAIITADTPGCRETIVSGVSGYLVPPRNVEALAAAMQELIVDAALRISMGEAARKRAQEKYDVHLVNRQMLAGMDMMDGH